MKKSAFIFASAIVVAMMCVFTGCSDDGDYIKLPAKPNEAAIEALRTTKTAIAFCQYSSEVYKHVDGKKWEEYDPPIICEIDSRHVIEIGYGPEFIMFNEGKVYCSLWSRYGIPWRVVCRWDLGELRSIWDKYVDETHPQQIYLYNDFQYNKKNKTLVLGGKEVGIVSCENNDMKISCLDDDYRTIDEYFLKKLPEDEEIITFDDCKEAYRYIINCAREKYGDVVKTWRAEYDLNEIERKLDTEPE